MSANRTPRRLLFGLAALVALLTPGPGGRADDTALFSANVPPNVVLMVDNSGSMAHIVWHEDFDPTATYSCNAGTGGWNPNNGSDTQFWDTNQTVAACGVTRTYYVDSDLSAQGIDTRFDERYLNWLHSLPDGDPRLTDLASLNNGTFSTCLGGGSFTKYRRSRTTAAKHILREVVCQVNQQGAVRFGIAQFREDGDPQGGHIAVPVADYSPAQDALIDTYISSLSPDTWTPLGEALFQVYTYFMSRTTADIPLGADAATRFPNYIYSTSTSGVGGAVTASPPASPVQWDCQKNFVVVITDGEPTRDDFDGSGGTATGFDDFDDLVGNYNPDDVLPEAGDEEPGDSPTCTGCEVALYLDDIAMFMQNNDFRPDMPDTLGIQKIDVYTVGFTTTTFANQLLEKAADVGGGEFYFSNDAESLANNIVLAITDIIQKSQSFTAATVPASRTVDGASIYISFFIPATTAGIWEGHLKNFEFNVDGEILDASGDCVVDVAGTPTNAPPCDTNGTLRTNATGEWDAADVLPTSSARSLYTSRVATGASDCGSGGNADCVAFSTGRMTAADIGIVDWAAQSPSYPGTASTTEEELADELVEYGRGCQFGVSPCADRTTRLGDIFHSNPLVVGAPNAAINDDAYLKFALDHEKRPRMIYAGANDGYLHAFEAGTWDAAAIPPSLDDGTGVEVFGFMPYAARQNTLQLPIDAPPRDFYYVDGSPQVGDVWWPKTSPTQTTRVKGEWHTVLLGGMRQGGRSYYALDVTNPPGNPDAPTGYPSYPDYLWEFPCEDAACNSWRQYMGETWSEPVITRVRVSIDGNKGPDNNGFERWVAVFAAGYDEAGDPNDQANYDGTFNAATSRAGRAIFMVDIASGKVLAVKHFDNAAADATSEMRYAIASTPSVFDLDFDGFADVIYVGDLGGNIWKWVVRDRGEFVSAPSDNLLAPAHDVYQGAWTFKKFFEAHTYTRAAAPAGNYYKSFFFPLTGTLVHGQLYLGVGSGERNLLAFEGFNDSDEENNRYYVILDPDRYEIMAPPPFLVPIDESDLTDLDNINDCAVIAASQGYFFRGRDGEKFISNSFIFLGDIWTGSFIPLNDADPCTAGGDAFIYRFDLLCGTGGFTSGTSPEDDRRSPIGTGIPTPVRISVGPNPEPGDDPECQTKVYMITSDGGLINECGGSTPSSAVKLINWRER